MTMKSSGEFPAIDIDLHSSVFTQARFIISDLKIRRKAKRDKKEKGKKSTVPVRLARLS